MKTKTNKSDIKEIVMKKRVLSLLLTLCMLCTALSVFSIPVLAKAKTDVYVKVVINGYYQTTFDKNPGGSLTITETKYEPADYTDKSFTYSYNSYCIVGYYLEYYSDPDCKQQLDYMPTPSYPLSEKDERKNIGAPNSEYATIQLPDTDTYPNGLASLYYSDCFYYYGETGEGGDYRMSFTPVTFDDYNVHIVSNSIIEYRINKVGLDYQIECYKKEIDGSFTYNDTLEVPAGTIGGTVDYFIGSLRKSASFAPDSSVCPDGFSVEQKTPLVWDDPSLVRTMMWPFIFKTYPKVEVTYPAMEPGETAQLTLHVNGGRNYEDEDISLTVKAVGSTDGENIIVTPSDYTREYEYVGTSLDKTYDGQPVKIKLADILATDNGLVKQPLYASGMYGKYAGGFWYNTTDKTLTSGEVEFDSEWCEYAVTGPSAPGEYEFVLQSAFPEDWEADPPVFDEFLRIPFTIHGSSLNSFLTQSENDLSGLSLEAYEVMQNQKGVADLNAQITLGLDNDKVYDVVKTYDVTPYLNGTVYTLQTGESITLTLNIGVENAQKVQDGTLQLIHLHGDPATVSILTPDSVDTENGTVTITMTQFSLIALAESKAALSFDDNAVYDIPSGAKGDAYTSETALTAEGGKAPYLFTVDPAVDGLSIDENNKLVYSRPSVSEATTAIIKVTDSNVVSKTITIDIGAVTAPTITSVSLSPTTATIKKGNTVQFTPTVLGTGTFGDAVYWELEGATFGTNISTDGLLSVSTYNTADTITVKATSVQDPTKFATATVNLKNVYAITVTGGTADKAYEAAGETVTVTADTPASGKQFKEWTGAEALTFVGGTSKIDAVAKITMPATSISLTAVYEDIPVTVSGSITSYGDATGNTTVELCRGQSSRHY